MKIEKIRVDEAKRYMGYTPLKPDEVIEEIISELEKEVLKICSPKYTYKIFEIEKIDKEKNLVSLKNTSLVFEGKDISNHLTGCDKVVVMACTTGDGIDKLLRKYKVFDMTRAIVSDCLGSALIEQICDEAQREICEKIDGFTTWRYSCGYGDFPLKTQKDIVNVLNMPKTIGVTLSDSLLMTPVKSVTAVFGVSQNPIEQKQKGCESCNLYETCNFRKRGERCNG